MVTMTYKRNLKENHVLKAEYIISITMIRQKFKDEFYLCQRSSSFLNYFFQFSAPNTQRRALKREVLSCSQFHRVQSKMVGQGSTHRCREEAREQRNIRYGKAWPLKLCFLCCSFINQTPPSFHPFPLMPSYDESGKTLNNPLAQSPCSLIV